MKSIAIGMLLIVLAFVAGAQKNALFGLLGFLAFFTVGVTVLVEDWKKRRKKGNRIG